MLDIIVPVSPRTNGCPEKPGAAQSEFLSTFALVVLGIYLRQRGSPESKPVAAPHGSTGH
jgi:hypothetical protein